MVHLCYGFELNATVKLAAKSFGGDEAVLRIRRTGGEDQQSKSVWCPELSNYGTLEHLVY